MRRALGGALVASTLVACTGLDLSGREYPCIPDAGPNGDYYFYASADPQCPAGWRCGLEGFCHPRDAGAAYTCVTDLNCEGGWRCSSDGVCVDASLDGLVSGGQDASYSVSRLNPLWLSQRPELFAQDEYFTSVDFFGNFPLVTPVRSFSFIADGGLLQGVVVQSDAGLWQAMPIASTRLRLEHYAALAEGPSVAYALAVDGTTDVFPYGGAPATLPWPGFPATALRMESSSDQLLITNFLSPATGSPTTGFLLAYGGNQYAIASGQTFDCTPGGGVQYSNVQQGLVPLQTGSPVGCIPAPDGGCETILDMAVIDPFLTTINLPDPTYLQSLNFGLPFPIPYDAFEYPSSFVAATADGLFLALGSPQCPTGGEFAFDDGTGGAPTPHWQGLDTVDIPNNACPQTVPQTGSLYTVRRLHGLSEQIPNTWMLGEEVPAGTDPSDNSNVSIALLGFGVPQVLNGSTGVNCVSTMPVNDYISCAACPAQAKFVGAQLSYYTLPLSTLFPQEITEAEDAGVLPFPIAEVRCQLTASDGTPVIDVFQFDFGPLYADIMQLDVNGFSTGPPASCAPVFVSQQAAGQALDLTLEDKSTSGNPSFAGDYGQIWLEQGLLTSAAPLTLTGPPSAAFGSGANLTLAFGDGGAWLPDAILGFSQSPTGLGTILGSVKNRPEWVVQSNGFVTDTLHTTGRGGPAVVAELDPTADPFRAPLNAVLLTLPNGHSQLVISSFDVLLGADMTQIVQTLSGVDGGSLNGIEVIPAPVDARAVPFAKSPVVSLAALADPSSDAGVFGGYALTANGLAQFSAVTQQHWDAQPVPVPQGNWVAVVDEAGRARIGYGDGSVYSLPSRVLLAPAFTDGTQVSDYATLCGETLALTNNGVFRLLRASGNAGAGEWVPLDLSSAAIQGASLSGLSGGRLYAPGGELDIFGRVGTVAQITCP